MVSRTVASHGAMRAPVFLCGGGRMHKIKRRAPSPLHCAVLVELIRVRARIWYSTFRDGGAHRKRIDHAPLPPITPHPPHSRCHEERTDNRTAKNGQRDPGISRRDGADQRPGSGSHGYIPPPAVV